LRYVRGDALWWISIIVAVFITIMVWLISAPAFDGLLDGVSANEGLGPAGSRQNQIADRVSNYFNVAPMLLVFGLVSWGFIRILRKEAESYY
tara:strand:+ start:538 stop:813 length:276 start_codon:yes stop_codon:yes gene_type:complete